MLECPCWTRVGMRWAPTHLMSTEDTLYSPLRNYSSSLLKRNTDAPEPRHHCRNSQTTQPEEGLVVGACDAPGGEPGALDIFCMQSLTSALLGIWDVDTKQEIWCLGPLKTTEVGLLISVGTRAYVGSFFSSLGGIHSTIRWILSFFWSKFWDVFLHRPQIVRHPAYML